MIQDLSGARADITISPFETQIMPITSGQNGIPVEEDDIELSNSQRKAIPLLGTTKIQETGPTVGEKY